MALDPQLLAARVRHIRVLLADSLMEVRERNPRARASAQAADTAAAELLAEQGRGRRWMA